MSGKLILVVGILLLGALAIAAVAVSFSERDPNSSAPRPGPAEEDERQPDRIPPPLESSPPGTAGEVAGRVVTRGGKPVEWALVTLLLITDELPDRSNHVEIRMGSGGVSGEVSFDMPGGRRELATAETGEDGKFSFETIETGPFTVRAECDGYAAKIVEGVKRGDRDVEVRMDRAGIVRGLVQKEGGAPVAGAMVRSGSAGCVTTEDGSFNLAGVPAGEKQEVSASANGFDSATATVTVAEGVVVDLDAPLTLTASPGISGRVFDPTGEPLKGVIVLAQQGLMNGGMGTSDEGGRYHLGGAESGDLDLSFRHPRYLAKMLEGVRHTKGERTIAPDVRLDPGGVIAGKILGPDGEPVGGARAAAVKEMQGLDFQDLALMGGLGEELPPSDSEGNFEVPGLATGNYTLIVDAKGFRKFRLDDVEVRVPETTNRDVRLEVGNTIAGRVVGKDGGGIGGAKVTVYQEYEGADFREMMVRGNQSWSAAADEEGCFEVRGLDEGEVRVSVAASGYAGMNESGIEIGSRDLTFTLTRTGTVSGRVFSADTGEPLEGASLTVGGPRSRGHSDQDGRFSIDGVVAGTHSIVANHPERAPATVSGVVVIEGAETSGIEVPMERGHAVRGTVVRLLDGAPVPGASVVMDGPVGRSVVADETGRFEFVGLGEGQYILTASADGFSSEKVAGLAVPANEELRVALARGGSVSGVVRDKDGEPQAGQMVLLGAGTDFGNNFAQTKADGTFEFKNLKPGRYTVMVMNIDQSGGGGGFGFDTNAKPVTVVEGEDAWLEFGGGVEQEKATVSGRLMSRGKPLGSRMLMLVKVGGMEGGMVGLMSSMKMVNTDAEGRFTLPALEPGSYRVLSGDLGQNMLGGLTLEVTETGEVEQDIVLPEGRLEGVVTGNDGKPVAGVKVTLVDPVLAARPAQSFDDLLGMMQAQSTTDDDGVFKMENVPTGTSVIQVSGGELATLVIDPVVVGTESARPMQINLESGAEITVRALSDQGAPLSSVPIIVLDGAGRRILFGDNLSVSTTSNGEVKLRLMRGTYRLIAQHEAYALTEKTVRVDRNATVEVRLAPGGSVSVMASGASGPVENALVRFFRDDGAEVVEHLTDMEMMMGMAPRRTGADGTLVRSRLPLGGLRVVVEAEDGRRGTAMTQVRSGTPVNVAVEVK